VCLATALCNTFLKVLCIYILYNVFSRDAAWLHICLNNIVIVYPPNTPNKVDERGFTSFQLRDFGYTSTKLYCPQC